MVSSSRKKQKGAWPIFAMIALIFLLVLGVGASMATIAKFLETSDEEGGRTSGGGGTGICTTCSGTVDYPPNVEPSVLGNCLDQWINEHTPADSPFRGRGSVFAAAGEHYGVNPALLIGIGGAESTYGTDWGDVNPETHNYQNQKWSTVEGRYPSSPGRSSNSRWAQFPSWETAVDEHARYIKWRYLDRGIDSVAGIGAEYTESGSPEWANTVAQVMDSIIGSCPHLGEEGTAAQQDEDFNGKACKGSSPSFGLAIGGGAYPISPPIKTGRSIHWCTICNTTKCDFCGKKAGNCKFHLTTTPIGDAVDIRSKNDNTTIYAVFDGVSIVGGTKDFKHIKLFSRHNPGVFALYGHLKTAVRGPVKKGQVIGSHIDRKDTHLRHCHFELWLNPSQSVTGDPGKILPTTDYNRSIWENIAKYLGLDPKWDSVIQDKDKD